jgi:hypothetical protein
MIGGWVCSLSVAKISLSYFMKMTLFPSGPFVHSDLGRRPAVKKWLILKKSLQKRAWRLSAESRTHQFLEFAALCRDAATINWGFCRVF